MCTDSNERRGETGMGGGGGVYMYEGVEKREGIEGEGIEEGRGIEVGGNRSRREGIEEGGDRGEGIEDRGGRE